MTEDSALPPGPRLPWGPTGLGLAWLVQATALQGCTASPGQAARVVGGVVDRGAPRGRFTLPMLQRNGDGQVAGGIEIELRLGETEA